jgi:hypothetical protein
MSGALSQKNSPRGERPTAALADSLFAEEPPAEQDFPWNVHG